MSIRRVMVGLLGILLVASLVQGWVTWSGIRTANMLVVALYDGPFQAVSHARSAQAGFGIALRLADRIQKQTYAPEDRAAFDRVVADILEDVAVANSRVAPQPGDPGTMLEARLNSWIGLVRRNASMQAQPLASMLDQDFDLLVERTAGAGYRARLQADMTIQRTQTVAVVVVGVTVGGSLAAMLLLLLRVAREARTLAARARHMAGVADRATALDGSTDILRIAEFRTVGEALDDARRRIGVAIGHLVEREKLAMLGTAVDGLVNEISAPVHAALTQARAARQRLDPLQTGELDAIVEQLGKIESLVDYLQGSAVGSAESGVRRIDLAASLTRIVDDLGTDYTVRGHVILVECPAGLDVETDPAALRLIIGHLVENSLTHGFQDRIGCVIRIVAERLADRLRLIYSDNGAGMSADCLAQVFRPFFTTNRGGGNHGLGMTMVYSHVTRLDGTITVQSAPNEGFRAVMELPLRPHRADASAERMG